MIHIKTKRNKAGNISIMAEMKGRGTDIIDEAVKIVLELPKALANNDPVLLKVFKDRLSEGIVGEIAEMYDDADETEEDKTDAVED